MQSRTTSRMQEPELAKAAELNEPPKPKGKNKVKVFGSIFLMLIVLGIAGFCWWLYAQTREETDDAYVDGHISVVSTRVSGNVQKVLVEDNQLVKAGQLLVTLDPKDYQVEVNQLKALVSESQYQAAAAKDKIGQSSLSAQGQNTQASGDISSNQADIESAEAGLLQAEASVSQAKAKVSEQEAQVNYRKSDFERYNYAYQNKAVTKQQYDQAKQNIEVAEAQLQQSKEALAEAWKQKAQARANISMAQGRLQRSRGSVTSAQAAAKQSQIDESQYKGAISAVNHSQAELDKAMLNLSYCHVVAPVSGRIGKKTVEVGQRIEPGQALMSIVRQDCWVTANYKETQVGRMHAGQPVEVRMDPFPGVVFHGKVDSFSPASGAKFSVLPPDNATGNFTKVVQRIPVKILLDPDQVKDYIDRISPGMSCVTTVLLKK